ncbi:hypothetical protein SAMN05443429_104147 [Cruoricaptor ignavus]|uniref:DUF2062 domain-containing protein n=1 Tax=Cruoricaptor ignavus TaxID=1118202 RepID=A0A1M6DYM4_9FLAO|nr:hypothetical protein SAMN05443429_104147 [Cruoricaptor ignavus]
MLESSGSNRIKALSVALGTFIAFSPFWGFHSVLAISLAVFFGLNKVLTFTFSNLSLPPLIPFVILASVKIGQQFIPGKTLLSQNLTLSDIPNHLWQYIVGSLILSAVSAIIFGFLTYFLLNFYDRKKN